MGTSSKSLSAPGEAVQNVRLDSWKEIAAYLDRDPRTVQLWEKSEGLPVHRINHQARATVYAFTSEIDAWMRARSGIIVPAVAPDQAGYVESPAAAPRPSTFRSVRTYLLVAAIAACILLAGVGVFFLLAHRRSAPASSLTVVLANFVNTTGEPAFDTALNAALAEKLRQSPYLNLMPDARIRLALRYMGLPEQERLTGAVARQVCQREGGQVVLQGTISSSGKGYDLWLRGFDCKTGKQVASQEDSIGFNGSALRALDRAADAVREQLGESSASLHQYDVPLEDASTHSMPALIAYSEGLQQSNEQGEIAAEPFFRRAIQIDPNFVDAYSRLSSIYWDAGEADLARQAATKAYELRDRGTASERFFALSSYYAFATGELGKEMNTYQEWGREYPLDDHWPIGLSVDYSYFGQYEKSAEMERLQIRNAPETAAAYGNLAILYLNLEQPDEAQTILDQAAKDQLYEINMDWARYWLAFYNGDSVAMKLIASRANASPSQESLREEQAKTEAYYGRMSASRALAEPAPGEPSQASQVDDVARRQAIEGLWETEFGQTRIAQADISRALAAVQKTGNQSLQIVTALALASIGQTAKAEALADALKRNYPLDTMLNQYWLPVAGARIALDSHKPDLAEKLLESTTPYETGIFQPLPCMYSVYLRGQAHLAEGDGKRAASDFRELIDHRGVVLNCPTGSLARLGLARALAVSGDVTGSRTAYQDLFALWRDADKDLPLLRQAQSEYRALH